MMNKLYKFFLLIQTIVNFPIALLDKLGLLQGEIIYSIRNKNLRFIARAKTEDIAEIVVVSSGYEYNLKNIKLPIKPIIIDLGAQIGTFSISIATLLKDKCKIYAFEPDTRNYSLFLRNIALNKICCVIPINIAISDFVGKGYLETKKINTDAYHLDAKKRKVTNCTITTLPVAMHKHRIKKIDLLKMDVEGAEYNIFSHKKSLDFIKKSVHYIFMEYHDINSKLNYSLIKDTIEKNFFILNKRGNILTLENKNWNKD